MIYNSDLLINFPKIMEVFQYFEYIYMEFNIINPAVWHDL